VGGFSVKQEWLCVKRNFYLPRSNNISSSTRSSSCSTQNLSK